jgi:hypothetical protein
VKNTKIMLIKLFIKKGAALLAITGLAFALIVMGLFHNDSVYGYWYHSKENSIIPGTNKTYFQAINKIAHILDIKGKFLRSSNDLRNGKQIQLKLKQEYLDTLAIYANSKPRIKKWLPGEVFYQGKSYEINLRLHGTHGAHYSNNEFSYTVNLRNKKSINGIKRFKLIKAFQAYPHVIGINYIAKKIGLISQVGEIKLLSINNSTKMAYYFVEDIKNNVIERDFGFSKSVIIQNTKDWTRKESDMGNSGHASNLDLFSGHIKYKKGKYSPEAVKMFDSLCLAIKAGNSKKLLRFFDMTYMSKFLALASVFNDPHWLSGDNLKLVYRLETKKFYPIYRSETWGLELPEDKRKSAQGFKFNSFPNFNNYLFNSDEAYLDVETLMIFKTLLMNNNFRALRDVELQKIINDKKILINDLKLIRDSNRNVLLFDDKFRRRLFNYQVKLQNNLINSTLSKADKYIHYNHIYGSINKKNQNVKIAFDAFSPVRVIFKDLLDTTIVGIEFDKNLFFENNTHFFEGLGQNPKIDGFVFINNITCDTISKNNIHINYIAD